MIDMPPTLRARLPRTAECSAVGTESVQFRHELSVFLDAAGPVGYARRPMLRVIRMAMQVVLFFLLLGVVIGIAAAETGVLEKLVLAVLAVALVWLAARVRRIGAPAPPRPA